MTDPTNNPGPRFWPLYLIGGGTVVALLWIWAHEFSQRQWQVLGFMSTAIISILLTLFWLLFLSRIRWRSRLRYFGGAMLAIALCVGLFRYQGLSGDFVPILVWRWTSSSATTVVDGGAPTPIDAHDWNQFLGPERTNQLREIRLNRDWDQYPPREIWRRPIGAGWSSFAIVGGRALPQEQHDSEEQVVCYDLATGRKLWSHADSARFESGMGGLGPRATPTIDGGQVFALGATGLLNCLDLESGQVLWSRDIVRDNNAKVPMFGLSGSPLVLDSLVVVSAGGADNRSLVAYHRQSGEFVWGGGTDQVGYSSPQKVQLAGREQILIFNERDNGIAAHDPQSGALLWYQPWAHKGVQCVANPLALPGDRVLASTGYGGGAELYQVRATPEGDLNTEILWQSKHLKAKFANMVYRDGFVYGLDDGIMVCLDLATGKRRWKRGRYGHGQLILVDDILLVMSEKGAVVLVEATPEHHRELARMSVFEDKTWNPPALAAPYLLLRTDREAACYELPLADANQP